MWFGRLSGASLGCLASSHGFGDVGHAVSDQTEECGTPTVADVVLKRFGHRLGASTPTPSAYLRRLGEHYQQAPPLKAAGQGFVR
jgi:hypothetical protein